VGIGYTCKMIVALRLPTNLYSMILSSGTSIRSYLCATGIVMLRLAKGVSHPRLLFPVILALCFMQSQVAVAQGASRKVYFCCVHSDCPPLPKGVSRATPDGAICEPCAQIAKESAARSKADYEAKVKQYQAEQARKASEMRAKAAEKAARKNTALDQLAANTASLERYEQLRTDQIRRRHEMETRYRKQDEQQKQEYQEYLTKIQNSSKVTAAGTEDDFWNMTVEMASYIPVKNEKHLWGYANKQNKMLIDYTYSAAYPFYKGVAFVKYGWDWRLIDNKGEIVKELSEKYLRSIRENGRAILGIIEMKDFSDGMAVARFSTNPYSFDAEWGAFNMKGEVAVFPHFHSIEPYKNGVAQAARFVSRDKYKFEDDHNYGDFVADFIYLEVGLIDKEGEWIKPPAKKMLYSYGFSASNGAIFVETEATRRRYTAEEREAMAKSAEWRRRKAYDQSMKQLQEEVDRRVDKARSSGMLVENLNSKR
jgi:hypothetical protein